MTRLPDRPPQRDTSPLPRAELEAPSLKAILEHSDDAIFCKTLDNIVTLWGRGAERVYGYSSEEMIGHSVERLLPPDRLAEAKQLMARIVAGEQIEHFETVRMTRAGNSLPVLLTLSPLRNAAGRITGVLTIGRDTSDTKAAQAQAREAQRRLGPLEKQGRDNAVVIDTANRVALGVLSRLTGVEALKHIAGAARTLAGARYAALGVARLDGQGLAEFVTVGLSPEEETMLGPRPKGLGILGHLLHRKEPLRIDSLASHPSSVGFPPNHPPMESFLGVPICRGDAVVGSLYLTNKENGGPFTEADELAVQALGAYAAVAINSLEMIARQRGLVRGLIAAQEDERRAVAYDLHDGLTQYVMASHAHLEAFRRANTSGRMEQAELDLDQGMLYLKEAVNESRRLVNGLRSLAMDDLGLAGALEQHLGEEKTRAGWEEAEFVHNIAGRRFDQTLETAVYRVAQEALTNARKHAAASRVRLLLLMEGDGTGGTARLNLEVRDWGQGFVPEKIAGDTRRVGLHSMAERVGLMNGVYQLAAAPGEGTTVIALFPVLEARPDGYAGDDNEMSAATPNIGHQAEASNKTLELNTEMRQINEQLLINGLHQQTLASQSLAIAEELQHSVLRRRPEKSIHGLKVLAFHEPVQNGLLAGGDLSDAFGCSNKSVMLVAGNVAGGELKPTRILEIRYALRAFAQDCKSPAGIISRLNEYMCDLHHQDGNREAPTVVLSLTIVDPITGAAQAVSSGAEPVLVLRKSGKVEEVAVPGPFIGINRSAAHETTNLLLEEGDMLLMTTTGTAKTRSIYDLLVSEDLLKATRKVGAPGMLHDMGKAITDAIRLRDGERFSGDICLLLARRDYATTL